MNIELFLHGVPAGAKFKGNDENEKSFFLSFYNGMRETMPVFRIQTRPSNGINYVYYTYLLTNNVYAQDGRTGSYFGMTIRIDSYWTSYISIFSILQVLFESYINGSVLSRTSNGGFQYNITDFNDSLFKTIESQLINLVQCTVKSECLRPSLISSSDNIMRVNMSDATERSVYEWVKLGVVDLSSCFPTNREKDSEQEIINIKSHLESKNRDLQNQLSNKENEVRQKEKRISELSSRSEPSPDPVYYDEPVHRSSLSLSSHLPKILVCVACLILVFLLKTIFSDGGTIDHSKCEKEKKELVAEIDDLKKKIKETEKTKEVQKTEQKKTISFVDIVRLIDISQHRNGRDLSKNTSYDANLKLYTGHKENEVADGVWRIEGGEIEGNGIKATFKITDAHCKITYMCGNDTVISRDITDYIK